MNGAKKLILILIALGLAAVVTVGLITLKFLQETASDSSEVVVFDVRPGENFKSVSRRLYQEQLVTSSEKIDLYARLTGQGGKIRVGEYAIRRDLRPREVLAILVSGRSIEYTVTVTEGSNRFEIGDALERQGIIKRDEFMKLTQDERFASELVGEPVHSLEGYLFPETYHITKFTGAKGLIKMMVNRFKENFAKIRVSPENTLRPHQLVILASIVEKETGAPEERAVIASVFYNRLKKGMRLQTDPTTIYGLWEKSGIWNRNISKQDLLTPNRYNTYSFEGLPFGPISNPGLEALKAAAAPAQTDYLYFVSRNNGTHVFTREYKDHAKAVAQFQMDRKAREGKSWRDLKNRPAATAPR